MIKVLKKHYDQIRLVYIGYIIIYWILRMILPINNQLSSPLFLGLLLFFSMCVAGIDILGERRLVNAEYGGIIVAYILWGILSLALNRQYGMWDGLVTYGFLAFQFMILYGTTPKTLTKIKKEACIVFNIICIISFIIALLGIATFLFEIDFWAFMNGIEYSQGFSFQYGRMWGILASANLHTGTFALLTILLSIIVIQWQKKHVSLFCHRVNIVIQLLVLVLSGSRSSILAGKVCALVLGWYYCKRISEKISKNTLSKQFIRIMMGVLWLVIASLMISFVSFVLPWIQQIGTKESKEHVQKWAMEKVEKIYNDGGFDVTFNNIVLDDEENTIDEFVEKPGIVIRQDIENKEDASNGRLQMWKEAGEIILEHPILGVGTNNLGAYVKKEHEDFVINSFGHCHNTYIELIACNGIIGFLILGFFLFSCAWKCLKYQEGEYKNRKIVGWFIGIIVILAGVVFFSEDIFFQMSFNSIIFWLVLGYIVRIIYLDKENANASKYAFICETGLHVFNSLKIVLNDCDSTLRNSDIYIYHQFQHSKEYAEKIKEMKIFNNVYEFEKYTNASGWLSKLQTFQRLITNVSTLKKFAIQKEDYIEKRYKVIVLGMITQFSNNIKALSYDAKFYFMEDGIGSYYVDLENEEMTWIYRLVNKYILADKLSYCPEKMYLNNPKMIVKKNSNVKICSIPQVDTKKDIQVKLQKIFSYKKNNIYQDKRFVYLSQPLVEVQGAKEYMELDILKVIEKGNKNNLIVRVHPRQHENKYKEYFRDTINNLWELECVEQISEKHVLISVFSTAQVMPKLLNQKEPILIFLFKIFGGFGECEEVIGEIQNMYQDKQRIYIPKNIEELEQIIKKINKN